MNGLLEAMTTEKIESAMRGKEECNCKIPDSLRTSLGLAPLRLISATRRKSIKKGDERWTPFMESFKEWFSTKRSPLIAWTSTISSGATLGGTVLISLGVISDCSWDCFSHLQKIGSEEGVTVNYCSNFFRKRYPFSEFANLNPVRKFESEDLK